MQKFLDNNKSPEEKEKKLNFEKEKDNSLLVCYTESINTIGDKSSISKERKIMVTKEWLQNWINYSEIRLKGDFSNGLKEEITSITGCTDNEGSVDSANLNTTEDKQTKGGM